MQLLSSKNRVLDHIFVSYIPGERTINPSRLFFSENSQMLTILESNICFAQLEENIFSLELEDSFSDIFLVSLLFKLYLCLNITSLSAKLSVFYFFLKQAQRSICRFCTLI